MSLWFSIIILVAVCFELFIISTVISFFAGKISTSSSLRSVIPAIVVAMAFLIGLSIGKFSILFFGNQSQWFGSSILFILSLKYLYQGLRLKDIRKNVNPTDNKGLGLLLFSPFVNMLFVGITMGLYSFGYELNIYVLIISFALSLMGLLYGVYQKKLIGFKYELLISSILLSISIVSILKM